MNKARRQAIIVSLGVSLVVVLGVAFFFSEHTVYIPPIGASELENLKYFEAAAELESRAQVIHGPKALFLRAGSLDFWVGLVVPWIVLAGTSFCCCVIYYRWVQSEGT